MTTTFHRIFRGVAFSMAMLVIVGASHTAARADEVTVSGSTTGAITAPNVLFTGSEFFTGTTALGLGSLSGVNSLGSFFVNTGQLSATGGLFQLNITFTTPTGILGGQGATYVATIVGSISPNIDQGGVHVDFLNPTQTFTFNDGVNTGSFSLTVADLFVQSGRSALLTAGITGQQAPAVPEPATLLLLGSGITGIAVKLRRRRKAKLAAETAEV
ncbi:MAG TPA: PEP-CTERM sorting domain-containing protein [Pyrinomonadaceae bacterium]|nr:PEP-CTERM sorting domain-containing protein [Pyrinomonadaceae bacterium]